MVAMEDSNMGVDVAKNNLEKHGDVVREEAAVEAHANAAPPVKGATASEVSPQTIAAEPNGNGNAHQHIDEANLDENGHEVTDKGDGLKQPGASNAASNENGHPAPEDEAAANGDVEHADMDEDQEEGSSEGDPEEAGEETEISDFDERAHDGEPASSGCAGNGSGLRPSYGRKTALEARSKIGVKPKRKYVRKKGVQAGSEQPSQGTEMGQEPQPMNGMESAHSGSGLDASSPGGRTPSYFPSGKRRGRPPGSKNSHPPRRGRGRGRGRGGRSGRGRGRWGNRKRARSEEEEQPEDFGEEEHFGAPTEISPVPSYYRDQDMEMDTLYGCQKCDFQAKGCAECQGNPIFERPKAVRWNPEGARLQTSVPSAPTFYPTAEEFQDPVAYIDKIRPEGEKAGIACIVPPDGWEPPFALERGTNGQSAESFKFMIRKQLTSHLCMRVANTGKATRRAPSRYDRGTGDQWDEEHNNVDHNSEFGFVTMEKPHTLRSFAAYADWMKALHFSEPRPKDWSEEPIAKKRRLCQYHGPEPSVEEIEAEFWRIVETPDEVVESLYGQDLDSGHHGSGFPLPPFRQRLLEAHLASSAQDAKGPEQVHLRHKTDEETVYSEHKWNINNMPRCKGSVLRYLVGEELITGVMVPWLYVGSCLSAFCWHVEDHALYSVNYLHMGAPKVWYGVPADASETLEIAMRDALPHLFEHSPDLLYQLVTLVSPAQLKARGVPVHRLVHREGSFVITFPNAYHAGFNTGFNCAEAVNFGPPDWLPWGTYVANKYRREGRSATLSHDALLIALVTAAPDVQKRLEREAKGEKDITDAKDAEEASKATAAATKDTEGVVAKEAAAVKAEADEAAEDTAAEADGKEEAEVKEEGDSAAAERAASEQDASTSGRETVPGQSTDLSFLDPINRADTPPRAIQLAAGELSLRVLETRRRLDAGLGPIQDTMQKRRMDGKPGDKDAEGVFTNTEDIDCEVCKGDLHLFSVVSPTCPGKATCPEHVSALECTTKAMRLLYRFTLDELEGFLNLAKECIPGVKEAVIAANSHKAHQSHEHEVVKLGPISMGERLRIGGDVSSDDDMDEGTPSPPPSSPKRSHKRRVLPPRSLHSSVQPGVKPKRKYTKRAEKWKYTKKAQAKATAGIASPEVAAPASIASPAADQEVPDAVPEAAETESQQLDEQQQQEGSPGEAMELEQEPDQAEDEPVASPEPAAPLPRERAPSRRRQQELTAVEEAPRQQRRARKRNAAVAAAIEAEEWRSDADEENSEEETERKRGRGRGRGGSRGRGRRSYSGPETHASESRPNLDGVPLDAATLLSQPRGANFALPSTAVRSVGVLLDHPPANTPPVTTGSQAQRPLLQVPSISHPAMPQQAIPLHVLAEIQRAMAHASVVAKQAGGVALSPNDIFMQVAAAQAQQQGSANIIPLMHSLAHFMPQMSLPGSAHSISQAPPVVTHPQTGSAAPQAATAMPPGFPNFMMAPSSGGVSPMPWPMVSQPPHTYHAQVVPPPAATPAVPGAPGAGLAAAPAVQLHMAEPAAQPAALGEASAEVPQEDASAEQRPPCGAFSALLEDSAPQALGAAEQQPVQQTSILQPVPDAPTEQSSVPQPE